jgi:MFS transporter, OFA family, oxalate/formate antiporter
MIRAPVFWVTYVLFVAVAAGGLMVTAQIGPMAADWKLASLPVQFMGAAALPLLTLTVMIDNLANGLTRPLCGFISDRIGRENTMFFVFVGEGLALLGLLHFGRDPVGFMIFAALNFLCWGEIFSIFPALCADTFGTKHAAANAGLLYTAKGAGSLLVPIASEISSGGNWNSALLLAAAIAIVAGIGARVVLRPMRRDYINTMNSRAFDAR